MRSIIRPIGLVLAAAMAATLVVTGAAPASAADVRALTGLVTPLTELAFALGAGETVTFSAKGGTQSADPVMHLLNEGATTQLRVDDNSGGGYDAKITFRSSSAAAYRLVLRSRTGTRGKVDLYRNGQVFKAGAVIGGWLVSFANVRKGDRISSVLLPNGVPSHTMYVIGHDGLSVVARMTRNGVAGAASWTAPADAASRQIVLTAGVVGWTDPATVTGWGKVVRNDVTDTDRDGLGDALERSIGTCPTRSAFVHNFDCSSLADARDTDGDGISDGWELLGRGDIAPHQPLPKWGANPRHKDMFVEVDFRRRKQDTSNLTMEPSQAMQFAAPYADKIGTLTDAQRAHHAATLRNPDGRPGINVHLDTGRRPAVSTDAALYGNWGGYTAVPEATTCGDWKSYMSPARYGIFRWALGYSDSSGGQTDAGLCSHFGFLPESGRPRGRPRDRTRPGPEPRRPAGVGQLQAAVPEPDELPRHVRPHDRLLGRARVVHAQQRLGEGDGRHPALVHEGVRPSAGQVPVQRRPRDGQRRLEPRRRLRPGGPSRPGVGLAACRSPCRCRPTREALSGPRRP